MTEFTAEQRKVVEKVEKLLAMANRKKGNEEEAAAAASKAQEILAAYNLDMATIEQGADKDAKREDKKIKGGMYTHQRYLWRAVAELNFCLYWTSSRYQSRDIKRRTGPWAGCTETVWGLRHQHRVVGRTVNVVATRVMAEYLEQSIERITMDRLAGQNNMRFSNYAVSYRKGAADRIIEKIQDRRNEIQEEEARKQREAEHRAARSGTSQSTAITIADVSKTERDANRDFIYGEGWSENQRKARREAAEREAEVERQHAEWAAANPEEARKEEEKRRKEDEKYWRQVRRRNSRASTKQSNVNSGAYYAGYDAAGDIGIDPQTSDKRSETRMIE